MKFETHIRPQVLQKSRHRMLDQPVCALLEMPANVKLIHRYIIVALAITDPIIFCLYVYCLSLTFCKSIQISETKGIANNYSQEEWGVVNKCHGPIFEIEQLKTFF